MADSDKYLYDTTYVQGECIIMKMFIYTLLLCLLYTVKKEKQQ